jgi:excisionase family DNA binding protein
VDSRLAVNVTEAARRLMVSPRAVWTEIASGRLRSFKVGRRRLIRVAAIEAFAELQEARQAAAERTAAQESTTAAKPVPAPSQRPPRPLRAPVPPVDGIVLPFIELPNGSVTTRAEQRGRTAANKRAVRSR